MKKTKLLAPILTIAGLGATVAPLMSLTSCGDKETITLELVKGEHVTKLETVGEVKIGKQFLIECSFEDGWRKIDPANTSIEVDGKKLEQGEDKDYHIGNSYQITVHSNAIKSQKAKVTVNAAATMISATYTWESTESHPIKTIGDDKVLLICPKETLYSDNLNIQIKKGDKSYVRATLAADPENPKAGEYNVLYKKDSESQLVDITESFGKDGFTFTDAMNTETDTKATWKIYISTTFEDGSNSEDVSIRVGNKPTASKLTADIFDGDDPIEKPYTKENFYFKPKAGSGEFGYTLIPTITSAEKLDCSFTDDGEGNWVLETKEKTGTITVELTSLIDSSIKNTITIEIIKGEE